MAKVTSKLQLTIPKAIGREYRIRPGDEVQFEPAGEVIRVVPMKRQLQTEERTLRERRLRVFDQATSRQKLRNAQYHRKNRLPTRNHDRGWKREELYARGRAR